MQKGIEHRASKEKQDENMFPITLLELNELTRIPNTDPSVALLARLTRCVISDLRKASATTSCSSEPIMSENSPSLN